MNRRRFLLFAMFVPVLTYGVFGSINSAAANIDVQQGLTFFSDGTQIISSENGSSMKLNDGSITHDESVIAQYLATSNRAEVSRFFAAKDNVTLDFNRMIIVRQMEGVDTSSEVTLIFDDTGNIIESYDTLGENSTYIYDEDDNLIKRESSVFGTLDISSTTNNTFSNICSLSV